MCQTKVENRQKESNPLHTKPTKRERDREIERNLSS